MDVALGVARDVVIQHVADALHIQAARGDIGGHQYVDLAVLEVLNGFLALRLLHVAVDGRRRQPPGAELHGQFFGGDLGACEYEHRFERLGFQDAGQRVEFVYAADRPVTMPDVGGGGRARLYGDLDRILEVRLGDALDLRRHRRREQHDLPRRRRLLDHALDVVDEAHAQHFVGFVEHQTAQFGQVQRAAVEVVDHAAGRADDDMHAALERLQLRLVALAAVDRQHVETGQVHGVLLESLGDLDRQFAGRRQHQRLRLELLRVDPRQDRQRERGGLAGAGLGLAEHVAACQQRRDGRGLDRRGRLVADIRQRTQQRFGQREIGEFDRRYGGFGAHGVTLQRRRCRS